MKQTYDRKSRPMCQSKDCLVPASKDLTKSHRKFLPSSDTYCSECIAKITGHNCAFTGCLKVRGSINTSGIGKYCRSHQTQLIKFGEDGLTPLRGNYGLKDGKPVDIKHGTTSAYSNHKCRCILCKEAWNYRCAKIKADRVGTQDVGDREHGTEPTYQYGCRCQPCREAHSNYAWELYQIRKLRKEMPDQNTCDCCGKHKDSLVTDHKRGTLKIRGLLCHTCNTGIGKLGDSLEGLQKAVAYLMRSEAD